MKIINSIAEKNPCYKAGKKITVKGLMLHSVGCAQPDPKAFVRNWQSQSASVCVHAVLGTDENVYQLLPWNYRGWHCGSGVKGSGNSTHIGIEMTEPSTIKYSGGGTFKDNYPIKTKAHVMATYKNAVILFAYLCNEYHLNPLGDGVIISHSEGCKRGIASNHSDVEHIWNKYGLTMKQFRIDVKNAMSDTSSDKKTAKKIFTPYAVNVDISNLAIRENPTINSKSKGYTGKGTFTIAAEAKGKGASKWGKLKSGTGWISLDYITKI